MPMPTPDQVPRKGSNVTASATAGEAILMLPAQGQIKVLNEVGTRVWDLIDGGLSIHELANAVCREYSVDHQQALADTLAFIGHLASMRLVTLHTADSLVEGPAAKG